MDFMKNAGLDERADGSEPSLGMQKVDAFGEMKKGGSGPLELRVGARVRHVRTGVGGLIKYLGSAGGRSIAVDWDDNSVGLHGADELRREF